MLLRLRNWLFIMFICTDQLAAAWIRGWYYVWIGGEYPATDETISCWVGRRVREGRRWAFIAERFLDGLLKDGHCTKAADLREFRYRHTARLQERQRSLQDHQ